MEWTATRLPPVGSAPGVSALGHFPAGATRAVLVLQEVAGNRWETERVLERLAAAGWAALAPDLCAASSHFQCVRQAIRAIAIDDGPHLPLIGHARAWLSAQTGIAADQVAVVGFCLGGAFALAVGPRNVPGWSDTGDATPLAILTGTGGTIGCLGDRLATVDVPVDMPATARPLLHVDYTLALADRAWQRIFAFLDAHVAQP